MNRHKPQNPNTKEPRLQQNSGRPVGFGKLGIHSKRGCGSQSGAAKPVSVCQCQCWPVSHVMLCHGLAIHSQDCGRPLTRALRPPTAYRVQWSRYFILFFGRTVGNQTWYSGSSSTHSVSVIKVFGNGMCKNRWVTCDRSIWGKPCSGEPCLREGL